MRETVTTAQARAESGDRLTLNERALLRLSATTATQNCARAVDICYNLGGASSIYAQNPLQRHFRDVHTVTQHVMVGQPTLEVAGRVFMDVPTDTTMF
jgi:alkylation response protein AidB-like acyl-CoA dehydrogenase